MLRVSHVFIPNSRQTMGTKSQRPWFVTDSKKPKLSDAPRIARAIRASPKQTMKQIVWGLQTTETHLSKVLVYVIFPKIVLNIPTSGTKNLWNRRVWEKTRGFASKPGVLKSHVFHHVWISMICHDLSRFVIIMFEILSECLKIFEKIQNHAIWCVAPWPNAPHFFFILVNIPIRVDTCFGAILTTIQLQSVPVQQGCEFEPPSNLQKTWCLEMIY